MKLRIARFVLLFLTVCLSRLVAQEQPDIRLLRLELVSVDGGEFGLIAGAANVTTSYRAQSFVPSQIFVRVFRGTKKHLIKEWPAYFKEGCIPYSTWVLPASAGGALRFAGLDTGWLTSARDEDITLVFEASDRAQPSLLRLDRAHVADYFNAGIEVKLKAPAGFVLPPPPPQRATLVHNPTHDSEAVTLPPCNTVAPYNAAVFVKPKGDLAETTLTLAEMSVRQKPCHS